MDFQSAKSYILSRLTKELSPKLYYHGVFHTWDVYNAASSLAQKEGLTEWEGKIVRTAALFHDCGFLMQYTHNEPIAVEICEAVLPQYGYTREEIDKIGQIVMATRIDIEATDHLEQVMCDADYDYFGRKDYHDIAGSLRAELAEYGTTLTELQWLDMQITFLEERHHYYTSTALKMRQQRKEQNVAQLKAWREKLINRTVVE